MSNILPSPVLVIGGGTMAAGIAARLVASGIDTTILVRRYEAIATTFQEITRRVGRLVELGYAPRHIMAEATVTIDAGSNYALVIESVAEDVNVKRAVLARAESLIDANGILATNTSSLRLTDLQRDLIRPQRFAGWHWFNPAELVPLVEVVGTERTAPAIIRKLVDISVAIGKQPVVVRRDVAGFIANRLQYALLREAYALVEAGICDVEDIDRAVVSGLGARWAAIGPIASMDAAGLEVHEAVAAQLFPQLSNRRAIPKLLRQVRAAGATGLKGGRGLMGKYPPNAVREFMQRRDTVLAALARIERNASAETKSDLRGAKCLEQ